MSRVILRRDFGGRGSDEFNSFQPEKARKSGGFHLFGGGSGEQKSPKMPKMSSNRGFGGRSLGSEKAPKMSGGGGKSFSRHSGGGGALRRTRRRPPLVHRAIWAEGKLYRDGPQDSAWAAKLPPANSRPWPNSGSRIELRARDLAHDYSAWACGCL